jgi:hypothetical protein
MRVARLKEPYPTAEIELWCEDEHRLGLKPIIGKAWSPIGERPSSRSTSVTSGPTFTPWRALEERRGPLVDPTHRQRGGVLDGFGELRQGSGSGKEQTAPARARRRGMAHGQKEAKGARRDTPGVLALALAGATTRREALAALRREGGQQPLVRGDRGVGGGAGGAMRGFGQAARGHPFVYPLPLVAGSGMQSKSIYPDLVLHLL